MSEKRGIVRESERKRYINICTERVIVLLYENGRGLNRFPVRTCTVACSNKLRYIKKEDKYNIAAYLTETYSHSSQ